MTVGLFGSSKDKAAQAKAIREHRDARKALGDYRSPTGREDDEYHRRNDRVIETEKNVPWWRR